MDAEFLKIVAFSSAVVAVLLALTLMYLRTRRRALNLRIALDQQRKDTLRSLKFMLKQLDYDAEVLRLLRYAKVSREKGDEVAFNGAIDELVGKEREMMKRLERAAEFEEYLKRTYSRKKSAMAGGKRPSGEETNEGATPEQMKSDIETFIKDLEKIRGGELKLLDEKVDFFGRWVDGPERAELVESLKAMEKFLEGGDTKGLEAIAERNKKKKKGKAK